MRTSTVIASYSPIIIAGIESILSQAKIPPKKIISCRPDEIPELLSAETDKTIVFVDTMSVSGNFIAEIKDNYEGVYIIGIYLSALPSALTQDYDAMLSVYSEQPAILQTYDKAVNKQPEDDNSSSDELTPREKDIVIGVVKGLSNKEIANSLNVSVNTVMTHRRNIASKLQIHSPSGLTIYAIVSKLVSIDDIKSEML